MSPEELEQKLAARLPTIKAPTECPQAGPGPFSAATQATTALMRSLGPAGPEADPEEERRARRRRIEQERAELWPRIKNPKLTAAVRLSDTRCALLLGPTGAGKTSAALWAMARYPGFWVASRDLGAAERRHPLGEGDPPLVRQAISAPTLYLDDLGTEDAKDLGVLQSVIDHRYAKGRATFVTSGLTRVDLSTYLGAAYVRRLVEQHVTRRDGTELPVLFVDCHGGKP